MNKFSVWFYQKTGYIPRSLIRVEKKFIMNNLNKFYEDYKKDADTKEFYLSFENYVGCRVGSWQADVGLYREAYTLINPIVGYKKMLKRLIRR
jgi:hypothetical protein